MADEAARQALHRVVATRGRNALFDPLALRVALRAEAPQLPAAEADLLVTVSENKDWAAVRRAALSGTDPTTTERAIRAVLATTALSATDADRVCRAFTDALTPAPKPAPKPAPPAGHYIDWGSQHSPSAPHRRAPRTIPAAPAPGHRRVRRMLLTGLGVLTVLGLLAAVLVALSRNHNPPAPDRFAPDQVGMRYRALGSNLLAGAMRCAPLPPQPGEREKINCSFGGWSVILTEYDSSSRLGRAREQALTAQPDATRERTVNQPAAAFAMREFSPSQGNPGHAIIYWDSQQPRPVNATIDTTELGLPALVQFWDERGIAGITRPAIPGAEFGSAALWAFATQWVTDDTTCGPLPANRPPYYGAVESVRCRYPNGAYIDFNRLTTMEQLTANRDAFSSLDGTQPGSTRIGGWNSQDGKLHGQLIEYVLAKDPGAHLYFDRADLLCLAHAFHPTFTQDQLKAFWLDVRNG